MRRFCSFFFVLFGPGLPIYRQSIRCGGGSNVLQWILGFSL